MTFKVIGTSGSPDYLKDTTGDKRYWLIKPRMELERVRDRLRAHGLRFDDGSINMLFVQCICDEVNAVLDEFTKDPENPQLLENAAVRLIERHEAALAAAQED